MPRRHLDALNARRHDAAAIRKIILRSIEQCKRQAPRLRDIAYRSSSAEHIFFIYD